MKTLIYKMLFLLKLFAPIHNFTVPISCDVITCFFWSCEVRQWLQFLQPQDDDPVLALADFSRYHQ